jgi:hypothetical protein
MSKRRHRFCYAEILYRLRFVFSKWLIESVNLSFALLSETRAASGRLFGASGKGGRKTTFILRLAPW